MWDSGVERRDTSLAYWQGAREEPTPAGGGEVGPRSQGPGRLEKRQPRWLGPWGGTRLDWVTGLLASAPVPGRWLRRARHWWLSTGKQPVVP